MERRPLLIVSRCFGPDRCRWDGEPLPCPHLDDILSTAAVRFVCPEMAIGLGVPRDPIRLVRDNAHCRMVQTATGRDLTAAMERFCGDLLSALDSDTLDGVILKSRSPSCGIAGVKIYPCTGKCMATGKGPGFFGDAVLRRFPLHAVEDEGRLIDRGLREHFLTRIFLSAEFRRLRTAKKMEALVAFHSRHKYLFKAYHQTKSALLGKIVANHDRLPMAKVLALYGPVMRETVGVISRPTAIINAYEHIFGLTGRLRHDIQTRRPSRRTFSLRWARSSPGSITMPWCIFFNPFFAALGCFFPNTKIEISFPRISFSEYPKNSCAFLLK